MKRQLLTRIGAISVSAVASAGVFQTLGADVKPTDVEGAHVWNVKSGTSYSSGSWEQASNWLVGDAPAEATPGADDKLWFKGAGTYSVSLSESHAVSAIYVGCPDSGTPKTTLDLGGQTLDVSGNVRVGWAWTYPSLTVTNGTMAVGGDMRVGFDSNLSSAFGYLHVDGPETVLKMNKYYWGMRSEGAASRANPLAVSGGAAFETLADTGSCELRGWSIQGGRIVYSFSGTGTKAVLRGGLMLTSANVDLIVSDGAEMSVSGRSLTDDWGQINRSLVIGRSASGCTMTIDNATVTVSDYPAVLGDCDQTGLGDNRLCVTNNGVLALDGVNLAVCRSPNGTTDSRYYEQNNRIELMAGGKITGGRSIYLGHTGQGRNSRLVVRDGEAELDSLVLGSCYLGISTNNWLEIGGTKSKVVCSSTSAGLAVNQRGGVEFTVGPDGYECTPVQIPNGSVSIGTTGQYWAESLKGAMPKLVVNDEGYGKKHGDVPLTLIECGTACKDALMMLATNLTVNVAQDKYRGVASVSEDGKKLLYTPPPKPGLVLIFR